MSMLWRLAFCALILSTPAFAANAALAHIQTIYLSVDNTSPQVVSLRMSLAPEMRSVKVAIVDRQSEADAVLTVDWPQWSEGGSGVITGTLKDPAGKVIWTLDLKTGSSGPSLIKAPGGYSPQFHRLAIRLRDDIKSAKK
jgi:hypothetical protein